jgi:dTDP-4-dehydrorhamnose reductase
MQIRKKNIIIGASGLIGTSLYNSFAKENQPVIGTYTSRKSENKELIYFDLTKSDPSHLLDLINPIDTIYLLSAYSNPSWIYDNQDTAKLLNFTCTQNFINLLTKKSPRLIFMSSVEVFNGEKGNYNEHDLPQPLNCYGRWKYEIEKYIKQNYENATIVRTGWNIGMDLQSRCVVSLTYASLLKPGAKMALDNNFSVVSVANTATALKLLSNRPEVKTLHLCSTEVITRVKLAQLICAHSKRGGEMFFKECAFRDIHYSEPRGKLNSLDNSFSTKMLGISYESAEQTIINKINLLDTWLKIVN